MNRVANHLSNQQYSRLQSPLLFLVSNQFYSHLLSLLHNLQHIQVRSRRVDLPLNYHAFQLHCPRDNLLAFRPCLLNSLSINRLDNRAQFHLCSPLHNLQLNQQWNLLHSSRLRNPAHNRQLNQALDLRFNQVVNPLCRHHRNRIA